MEVLAPLFPFNKTRSVRMITRLVQVNNSLCFWGIFPLVAIAGVTLHKVVHIRPSVHFRPSPSGTYRGADKAAVLVGIKVALKVSFTNMVLSTERVQGYLAQKKTSLP